MKPQGQPIDNLVLPANLTDAAQQNQLAFLRRANRLHRDQVAAEAELDALEAFLHTLTDEALIEDPKFSDPFVETP